MDTLKYIKNMLFLLLLFNLYSCHNDNREFVKSEIWIWDWNDSSIPKKAYLLRYENESSYGKLLDTYKNDVLKIKFDTLNKKKYLLLNFKNPQSKLATQFDYKLIIDDTIQYKILDFKTAPKKNGGDVFVKINNDFTEIGDDNIIQFNKSFMEIIQK